jgi:hypothetical protein
MSARRTPLALVVFVVLGLALTALPLTGCARNPRQTAVIVQKGSDEASGTITPLERGKLRREALRAAEAGLAAWIAKDDKAMKKYFAAEQVEYYGKKVKSNLADGRVRIRAHKDATMEVVDMSKSGREVLIDYQFTDMSRFEDPDGNVIVKPTGKDKTVQLTLDQEDDGWIIVRMIGGSELE